MARFRGRDGSSATSISNAQQQQENITNDVKADSLIFPAFQRSVDLLHMQDRLNILLVCGNEDNLIKRDFALIICLPLSSNWCFNQAVFVLLTVSL